MKFVRSDVLVDKKGIHIKLDKHIHYELRALGFKMNISMQELFQEFASALVNGNINARHLVDGIVMRKIKRTIESLDGSKKREDRGISELDHDSLYGLIEDEKKDKTDEAS